MPGQHDEKKPLAENGEIGQSLSSLKLYCRLRKPLIDEEVLSRPTGRHAENGGHVTWCDLVPASVPAGAWRLLRHDESDSFEFGESTAAGNHHCHQAHGGSNPLHQHTGRRTAEV